MNRIVPLVLASTVLLSLPAAAQQSAKPEAYKSTLKSNCTPDCVATIIVPFGCGSGIRVAPEPIIVEKGRKSTIKWNVTGQWQFDKANGIFIHAGGSAFTEHALTPDSRSFTVVINHPTATVFKYDINLVGPGGACRLDPTIINQ